MGLKSTGRHGGGELVRHGCNLAGQYFPFRSLEEAPSTRECKGLPEGVQAGGGEPGFQPGSRPLSVTSASKLGTALFHPSLENSPPWLPAPGRGISLLGSDIPLPSLSGFSLGMNLTSLSSPFATCHPPKIQTMTLRLNHGLPEWSGT